MVLWTIQPESVYRSILETGIYRCDENQITLPELKPEYDWLVSQMIMQISPPPSGVRYPVWAWHSQMGCHKKPDLRIERWCNGSHGDKMVCLEIEIPDEQVLLSDFNAWSIILLHGFITDSEEEADKLEQQYSGLSLTEQKAMQEENWMRVFDLEPVENRWTTRGKWIQATFWELRREQIRKVWHFTAVTHR